MSITYNEETLPFGKSIWYEQNGYRISFTDSDPANSDYQRYLRWLEDPEAEENGTISQDSSQTNKQKGTVTNGCSK